MKEIYQLLSNAMNQELRMSQIANNLANINTPGFKRDDSTFQKVLKSSMDDAQGAASTPGAENSSPSAAWTSIVNSYIDFRPGEMRPTGNPLDVAIDGPGFFEIQGDNNDVLYTRAGNFKINEKNELVTATGRKVLNDAQQPIKFNLGLWDKPKIFPDGTIYAGAAASGKLGIVQFANPQKLVKLGEGGLFTAPSDQPPQAVAKLIVRQEMLENSNVSAVEEMVQMIQTERNYQVQQKVIQTIDDLTSRRLDAARS